MGAQAHAESFQVAEALVQRAEDRGFSLDDKAYTRLITQCARHGDVTRASRLISRMEQASMKPSTATLLAVLHACTPPFAGLGKRMYEKLEELLPVNTPVLQEACLACCRPLAAMGDCQGSTRLLTRVGSQNRGQPPKIAALRRFASRNKPWPRRNKPWPRSNNVSIYTACVCSCSRP